MEALNSPELPKELDYPVLVLGSTPMEKLCIAIINAHPERDRDAKRTAQKRLREAVYALEGFYPGRGDNEADDDRVLRSMSDLLGYEAHQQVATEVGLTPFDRAKACSRVMVQRASDSRSCRALAKRALQRCSMQVTEADKKRLARKFMQRWRGLRHEEALATPPPKFEDVCMAQIVTLLNRMGIPAVMPDDPGAFWELSIAK